ncbi:MAG: Fe-S cluster assembly protein SufD [Deltaproteobacteria bacterium]|nr:Fe-S cluster assembly protein SufD [Deltaproteobacteria bacterium]
MSGLAWTRVVPQDALSAARAQALATFDAVGFPTRKDEDWKYTSVKPILDAELAPQGDAPGEVFFSGLADTPYRLIFVDGHLVDEALPEGVRLVPLGEEPRLGALAPAEASAFVALNTASFVGGVGIVVRRNATVTEPLVVVSALSDGETAQSVPLRLMVVVEDGAELTLVEQHPAGGAGLLNLVTEVFVGENAQLRHLKVVEGDEAFHVAHIAASVARVGRYLLHSLALSGALTRTSIRVELVGEGAEADLSGLFLGRDDDRLDHTLHITHDAPRTRSNQRFKGILDGQAQGVFTGMVQMKPGATGADAQQKNPNLLLSQGAVVHTRPQLLIDHDDISASHGATVGQLDEAALFYARQRGIDADAAQRMLTRAFALDVLETLPEGSLRDLATAQVESWMETP